MQIYSINSDKSISPVLSAPFTPTYGPHNPGGGDPLDENEITWDNSGSYLLVSSDSGGLLGGIGVLQLSGNSVAQTFHPAENFGVYMYPRTIGSFVYGVQRFAQPQYHGWVGYLLQGGGLGAVPGSPFGGGNPTTPIAIY